MLWRAWFRKRRWERGVDAELQFHIDQQTSEYIARGLSEEDARRRAQSEFGAVELAKDECRDQRGMMWLDHLLRDVRLAVRGLRRSPGFTLVAILVLGAGIGSSTAIFSTIHGVLLKTLPYPEAGRLFAVHEVLPKFRKLGRDLPVSARHFAEWRSRGRSIEGVAIFEAGSLVLTSGGAPESIPAALVSAQFFPLLGIQPYLGRLFRPDEEAPGHDRVVVLSHSLWKQRFQGDAGVVGRSLQLNGESFEVIGVLGEDVRPALLKDLHPITQEAKPPRIWKPLGIRPEDVGAVGDFNYAGIVRLKSGVDVKQSTAELSSLADTVARQEVPDPDMQVHLVPLQEQVGAARRQDLLLLLAAVGVVLLIVCITVGNLLLARGLAQLRDLSIRSALGASRARLVSQMLVESVLLSLVGAAAGLALARLALSAALANAPVELPRMDDIRIDGPVLAFALVLALATAVLFGLLPAWRLSRTDPQEALKAAAHTTTAARRSGRLRELLVTAQIGLSMICLATAGLLLHSFVRLGAVDKGFRTERILTLDVPLIGPAYATDAARAKALRGILDEVRALPGVQAAAISNRLPLKGEGSNNIITVEGPNPPLLERPVADFRYVNPGYFDTFSIPLRAGRAFEEADGERRLAVVSVQLAQRLWPGQQAVGQRFRMGDPNGAPHEVIGVAGDVRSGALDKAPVWTAYFPYRHRNRNTMMLAVRTAMDPLSIAAAVRRAIWKVEPAVALTEMKTMAEVVSATLAARRFQIALVGLFAAIGVLLACVGVYGVVAYAMTQRRNEIGIRVALGASRGNILGTGLRHALVPVGIGVSGGLALSLAAGRLLERLLFGIQPHDPAALGAAALLMGAVTIAACLVPIVQASRLDPALTLRNE